jgi:hypothetical protein
MIIYDDNIYMMTIQEIFFPPSFLPKNIRANKIRFNLRIALIDIGLNIEKMEKWS